jgi:hypothetical protein
MGAISCSSSNKPAKYELFCEGSNPITNTHNHDWASATALSYGYPPSPSIERWIYPSFPTSELVFTTGYDIPNTLFIELGTNPPIPTSINFQIEAIYADGGYALMTIFVETSNQYDN